MKSTDMLLRNQTEGAIRELAKATRELARRLSGDWERDYLRVIKDLLRDAEECHAILERAEGSAIVSARAILGRYE